MQKAWYILNYHNVAWEEGPFLRPIGGTFPPDVFADHVETLANEFELVSVQDGHQRLREGRIDRPLLSFWFDDGFTGVRRYAAPILARHGLTGATSVNSRFMLRQEFFWRLKLGYLVSVDGLRFVRSGLRKLGIGVPRGIRSVLMDNFSDEVRDLIDRVYTENTSETLRDDAWRLLDDVAGMRELKDAGWVISNHSAAHYPVSETAAVDKFVAHYHECEAALNEHLDVTSDYWVMPFDRPHARAVNLDEVFASADPGDRQMVFVSNRLNRDPALHTRKLFRVFVPPVSGRELLPYLAGIPVHTG